jgi:TolB protein
MVDFLPSQSARIRILDIETGESATVFESSTLFVEAPNLSPDGRGLIVNADGGLWRLPLGAGRGAGSGADADARATLERIPLGTTPALNNDHVISPDGSTFLVTARDGHLYEIPFDGLADGVAPRRITSPHPTDARFKFYLHGVSRDGAVIAAIGGGLNDEGTWVTNVYLVPVDAGSAPVALTSDDFPDDGAEFAPDGRTLWFNSERAAAGTPGHSQLFRLALEPLGIPEQITFDDRVNWFPHPSPDGRSVLYLSYPAGTLGHPANLDVELRLFDLADGSVRTLAAVFGGQGSINVPCWSADSRRVAYVDYPLGVPA